MTYDIFPLIATNRTLINPSGKWITFPLTLTLSPNGREGEKV
jgi:hypothetical protein